MKKALYTLIVMIIFSGIAYGMVNLEGVYGEGRRHLAFAYAYAQFALRDQFAATGSPGIVYAKSNGAELGIPVLLYHGIVETPDRFSLTQERFMEHMRALKVAGYQTISMADFRRFVSGEQVVLPEKPFVLTFDDGRKDSFLGADAVLALYGFHATMFLPSTLLSERSKDSTFYLSPTEISVMAKSGRWEIQSHAIQKTGGFVPISAEGEKGYLLSNRAWLVSEARLETIEEYRQRIVNELAQSKEELRTHLGIEPIAFSYPFGDFGRQNNNNPGADEIILEVIGDHYPLAFRQVWPYDSGYGFNYPGEDARLSRRIEPSPAASSQTLVGLLEDGKTKALPFIDDFSKNDGWKVTWGQFRAENSEGILSTKNGSTGGFVFLDGSFPWTNYRFTVTGRADEATQVTLVAHYVDQINFTSCSFDEQRIWIESYKDGIQTLRKIAPYSGGYADATLGVRIADDSIGCEVNGELIVEQEYNVLTKEAAPRGGVGIKVWSPEKEVAKLTLQRVLVDPLSSWEDHLVVRPQPEEVPDEPPADSPKRPRSPSVRVPIAQVSATDSASSTLPEVVKEAPLVHFDPIALFAAAGVPTPYIENFATTSMWRTDRGLMSTVFVGPSSGFRLQTATDTSGALYFLRGSDEWQDYDALTSVDWVAGTTFSVIGRRVSDRDYVECAFSKGTKSGSATLYVYENGLRIKLFQSPRALLLYGTGEYARASVGISVKEKNVTCNFNGYPLIEYQHPRLPLAGGIGWRLWDSTPGKMTVQVRALHVSPLR